MANWPFLPYGNAVFFAGVVLIQLLLIVGILHHLCGLTVFSAKRNKYEARCIIKLRNDGGKATDIGMLRFLDSRARDLKFLSDASSYIAIGIMIFIVALTAFVTYHLGLRLLGTAPEFVVVIAVGGVGFAICVTYYVHELRKRIRFANCIRYILRGTEEMNKEKIEKGLAIYNKQLSVTWLNDWFGESEIYVGEHGMRS